MIEEEITSLEALGIAIRDLIDAQELYWDLANMTDNDLLRDRFMNLHYEEKKQQHILEKKYKEMFPNVELMLPPSRLPKEITDRKLLKKKEVKEVLRLAIDQHKQSREFYLDCAESVSDLSGKRMFRFLADMKFSHQMMLSAEFELLEKYPSYLEGVKNWETESRLRTEKIKRRED